MSDHSIPWSRLLEQAISLAVQAHTGQKDKAGNPYILHPLRLMMRMTNDAARILAVLHDVVEDTAVTLTQLQTMGFPDPILAALDALTHRPGESYDDYVTRLGTNPLAIPIKLADLEDNMDLRRLERLTDREWERMQRYLRVWRVLSSEKNDSEPPRP